MSWPPAASAAPAAPKLRIGEIELSLRMITVPKRTAACPTSPGRLRSYGRPVAADAENHLAAAYRILPPEIIQHAFWLVPSGSPWLRDAFRAEAMATWRAAVA